MTSASDSPSFVLDVPEGIQIRDPETGRVAQTGESVPRAGFWGRRLAAGDVRELQEPRARSPVAAPPPSDVSAPKSSRPKGS